MMLAVQPPGAAHHAVHNSSANTTQAANSGGQKNGKRQAQAAQAVAQHAARTPRFCTSMATKKPARMKNTGMRNAWMKAVSRSAATVVRSSRQGNGESFTM
jgi:hypothetical protein